MRHKSCYETEETRECYEASRNRDTTETHTRDTHATETTLFRASKERHPRRCHKIDMLGSRQRR